jgi:hypothetical protein
MPLRQHENIYVFNGNNDENEDLMNYSKKVLKHIGKTKSTIKKEIPTADHFFRYSKGNFSLPTKETYEKLIELYNIDEMEEFIPFNELEENPIYNPQKTEGKPYKTNEAELTNSYYRGGAKEYKTLGTENKGDRHPTSIIDHENIYVFDNDTKDQDILGNRDLREYSKKLKKYLGITQKEWIKKKGYALHSFFYRTEGASFGLPKKETYDELIKEYNIDEMGEFLDYEILESLWEGNPTYNPQKTEGTPYKTNEAELTNSYYRGGAKEYKTLGTENKGDRHPTSIIDHENIYVFDNPKNEEYNDLELSRNKDLREYAEKVYKFIGKGLKTINKKLGHRRAEHFFYFKTTQFCLTTKKTYNELIKEYKINEMEGFLDYEILDALWEDAPPKVESTYNSQKTEGEPYKSKERTEGEGIYIKDSYKRTATQDTTNRHPTSILNEIPEYEGDTILVYKNPHKTIHRTQKPVELLEWLIKTYSNEGDLVMDFTMGSGTCAVACMNTKRKFIGVEMDEEIFNLAKDRIENHK